MNVYERSTIPGFIYFRDNERDYKIGITNDLVRRGRDYKTENPRDTVVDTFRTETYAEAQAIEAEMKQAARAEGLCSFENSDEWLERTERTEAFWNRFVQQYAKKTYAEWDETYSSGMRKEIERLNLEVMTLQGTNDSLQRDRDYARKSADYWKVQVADYERTQRTQENTPCPVCNASEQKIQELKQEVEYYKGLNQFYLENRISVPAAGYCNPY